MFRDIHSGEEVALSDAVRSGFVHPTSASFRHPGTHAQSYSLTDALTKHILESTGHYTVRSTQERLDIETLIQKKWLVFTEVESESKTSTMGHISETKNVVIESVLDPRSEQFIDVDTAVKRRLLNTQQGTYTHPITTETMTIQTALDRGFLRAETDASSSDFMSSNAIKESRSFTITGAVDPSTGHRVDVAFAIEKGIIDQANGQYVGRDAFGREKRMPISEAIKKGFVIASATTISTDETDGGPKYIKVFQLLLHILTIKKCLMCLIVIR